MADGNKKQKAELIPNLEKNIRMVEIPVNTDRIPIRPGEVATVSLPLNTMKFHFSGNPRFGFAGEAFLAQLGTGALVTGPPIGTPGLRW